MPNNDQRAEHRDRHRICSLAARRWRARTLALGLLLPACANPPTLRAPAPPEVEAAKIESPKLGEAELEALRRRCESDNSDACVELAIRYSEGSGGAPRDLAAMLIYERRACELADGHGCNNLGNSLRMGIGTRVDIAAAVTMFARACELEYTRGCTSLARAYLNGDADEPAPGRARALLQRACDQRDASGCYELARYASETASDPIAAREAAEVLRSECERGRGDACTNYGHCLRRGVGVKPSMGAAFTAYERACELDSDHGCYDLAMSYLRGSGVEAQPERGIDMLRHQCADKHRYACEELADLVSAGRIAKRDPRHAAAIYDQACSAGSHHACVVHAERLLRGDGVTRDVDAARALLRTTCIELRFARSRCASVADKLMRGDRELTADPELAVWLAKPLCRAEVAHACGVMSYALYRGRGGVGRDSERAESLRKRACDGGDIRSCAPGDQPYLEQTRDPAELRKVVGGQSDRIRECYDESVARTSSIKGRILIDFGIEASGAVYQTELVSSFYGAEELARCVVQVVEQLEFPPDLQGGAVVVRYPFEFGPGRARW